MQLPTLRPRVTLSRTSILQLQPRLLSPQCRAHPFKSSPLSFSSHHPLRHISRSPTSLLASPVHTRGKKTKASISLDDLPQGLIPLEPLPLERDDPGPVYPTVVQQARDHMRKFDNCVLLTRVGGFYELYFEHAEEFGELLGLKVVPRTPSNAPTFSMAGFPFFQLDRYLKILVQDLNRYVAIAEEFRNEPSEKVKSGGLMHDRRVTRIITPGTLIDENFMDPFSNNYVLAIHVEGDTTKKTSVDVLPSELPRSPELHLSLLVGLAWLDLSTGHFFTQSTTLAALPSFLSRISPREIVLDEDLQRSKNHGIFSILADDHHLITYRDPSEAIPLSQWEKMLESPILPRVASEFTPEEIAAGSSLLQYVEARLQGSNMKLQPPVRQLDMMGIDKNTMRALEIKKTMREDIVTGSLLHTVRRTVTKGGARLLDNWLSSPSTSLPVINSRLDIVTHLLKNPHLLERITHLLKRTHDTHRLLQKFAFGRGDPDDLLALAKTIHATTTLTTTLSQPKQESPISITALTSRINLTGPTALAKNILAAIDEEGISLQSRLIEGEESQFQALAQSVLSSQDDLSTSESKILPKTSTRKAKPTGLRDYYSDENEAWTMKPAASPTLARLHKDLLLLTAEKETLGKDLCARLGASTLTLRFTPGLGHICHIKGKDTKLDFTNTSIGTTGTDSSTPLSSQAIRNVSSSKSTRSFQHPEWTALGTRLIECRTHIRTEELRVFNTLRQKVILNIVKLRRNAAVLDELDIACSFATLAGEKDWVRPLLNDSCAHNIVEGRHPTVEGGLREEGRTFVGNDCFVGGRKKSWLISGPNMAGKSTFLRQNALITILAQVGSYVPALFAEIGIVDQIFSRVGSADNLYKDQSTFMVEMLETANILKAATKRSFVIMDEIGRGTTPDDGTAVAFACLWHLTSVNGCRTLFATHFHDLADMVIGEGMEGDVGFYCTDVKEDGDGKGGFRYVHRLREGVNKQSHALKVARLAGLPNEAIRVARKVLDGTVVRSV